MTTDNRPAETMLPLALSAPDFLAALTQIAEQATTLDECREIAIKAITGLYVRAGILPPDFRKNPGF